jgi:hypothetical protein
VVANFGPEQDTPTSCVLATNIYFKPTLKIMVFTDVTYCGLVEVTSTWEEAMSFTFKTFHTTLLFSLMIITYLNICGISITQADRNVEPPKF